MKSSKDLYLEQKYFVVRSDISSTEEDPLLLEMSVYNGLYNVGTEW